MPTYHPSPIDTSSIVLPDSISPLIERLASNIHDIWAQGRLSEGWRFGPRKNGDTKETPLLVPYEELSEAEKEYDRATAVETLKVLLSLGYRIESSEPDESSRK